LEREYKQTGKLEFQEEETKSGIRIRRMNRRNQF